MTEFLKAHGCDATADELKEFVAEKAAQDRKLKLSDEELDTAAGGTNISMNCIPDTALCTGCGC